MNTPTNTSTNSPTATLDVASIWKQACSQFKLELSSGVYNTWILGNPLTEFREINETQAIGVITSPTAFHSTNLKKNLEEKIKLKLKNITGKEVTLDFVIGSPVAIGKKNSFSQPLSPAKKIKKATSSKSTPKQPPSTLLTPDSSVSPRAEELFSEASLQSADITQAATRARNIGLNNNYTFESFAVSTSNEMAHAAATAVSNSPGKSYNPLFLYGGVGVGKTHLMHAIAFNILQQDPLTNIIYCTGEEFTNEIVKAIQTKTAIKFKEKYRTPRVLLIDDVQFIAGKKAVQEEFFHTFNALIKNYSQIVLTSERAPTEILTLESRLKSRFEAGLVIDIQEPSFETRTAIVLIKAKNQGLDFPIELAKTISTKLKSARKIEGVLTRIKSLSELGGKEVNQQLVDSTLLTEDAKNKQVVFSKPQDIIKIVANFYQVKQAAVKGKRRVKHLALARHVAMFIMREDLRLAFAEIGRWFSSRDHTSVMHAVKKIKTDILINPSLEENIVSLRASLQKK